MKVCLVRKVKIHKLLVNTSAFVCHLAIEILYYLYINVLRYVKVEDLIRQLESSAEERITSMTFCR